MKNVFPNSDIRKIHLYIGISIIISYIIRIIIGIKYNIDCSSSNLLLIYIPILAMSVMKSFTITMNIIQNLFLVWLIILLYNSSYILMSIILIIKVIIGVIILIKYIRKRDQMLIYGNILIDYPLILMISMLKDILLQ